MANVNVLKKFYKEVDGEVEVIEPGVLDTDENVDFEVDSGLIDRHNTAPSIGVTEIEGEFKAFVEFEFDPEAEGTEKLEFTWMTAGQVISTEPVLKFTPIHPEVNEITLLLSNQFATVRNTYQIYVDDNPSIANIKHANNQEYKIVSSYHNYDIRWMLDGVIQPSKSTSLFLPLDESGEVTALLRSSIWDDFNLPNEAPEPDPVLESFTLSATETSILVGDTSEIHISAVVPETASMSAVTYSSSDTGAATVTNAGVVTGVAEGISTITATDAVSGVQSTIEITVSPQPAPEE